MRYGLQLLGGENRFIITRARKELGFEPRAPLAEGVRESVAWYRGDAPKASVRASIEA
jgi:nucleoside-diphosphate-sugar epimerase